MPKQALDVLESPRLPALCRGVCLYAGLPLPPAPASGERFVVRSGGEPAEFFVRLLCEGFAEDGVEVHAAPLTPTPLPRGERGRGEGDEPDSAVAGTAKVLVRSGFAAPCPDAEELSRAVAPEGGPVLLFGVERLDAAGRLLGVTWAALPEEEPPPQGHFRAAVRTYDNPVAE